MTHIPSRKELTMSTDSERRWERISEVAARYNLSTQTIRRRIADGTFLAYRLGPTSIRLDSTQVDRAMRPVLLPSGGANSR